MYTYIEAFCDYLEKERGRSKNTILSYTLDLRNFYEFLLSEGIRAKKPDKMNQTNIMAYMLHLEQSGKTAATICRKLATIKSFCKFLLIRGHIKGDPAYKIKAPKTEKKLPPAVEPETFDILMRQPDRTTKKGQRDIAMLSLLFSTGIQVSELINLNLSDVRIAMGAVECHTGKKKKTLAIDKNTQKALKTYKEKIRQSMLKNPADEAFFVNCGGTRFTRQGLWKIIKAYARKAKIDENITPSVLRHSFAMHLVAKGEDMESVQQKLGHADTATTQIYFRRRKK